MIHRAFSFSISDGTLKGHGVAVAVVAPTARYASLHTIGEAECLAPRFATPPEWRDVDAELNPPPTAPAEFGSPLRHLILGGAERSLCVTFVRWDDIEIESPEQIRGTLDAHLRALAAVAAALYKD